MDTLSIRKISGRSLTLLVGGALVLSLGFLAFNYADAVQSPPGCTADNSVVNISSDVATAQVGDTITFTVSAGNPASVDGCDITGRTLTLTLPDGSFTSFGPFNYPNPTATAVIGSAPYIASSTDLVGGVWIANVSWNGTLKNVVDLPSNGSKNISVNEVEPLEVTKTAVPASEIEYTWTIDKSVVPESWNLFAGDGGTSEYTIDLVKSVGTETFSVSGTISIHNPNNVEDATVTDVDDEISGLGPVTVACPVVFPSVLAAGQTLECTYSSALPDDSTRTNTATVTTSGAIDGGSGQASIDFAEILPTVTNGSVSVDDTFPAGDFGPVSQSTTHTYTRTFECGSGEGMFEGTGNLVNNTATIVGTELSDSAQVTVNCYELRVTKDADTSFTRTYQWNVEKTASETELDLAEGETYQVDYTVTATVTGSVDSAWAVSGTITVNNPAPISATINSVADLVSNNGAATVDCGATVFPYTLAGSSNLVCTYSMNLPDGDDELNTATASQQNYDYDEEGAGTPNGTTDYSGTANVDFGAPTSVIDEQVEVSDPMGGGVLGTATVAESPKQFQYSIDVMFEGEEACGDHTINNTATITTNDTETQDTASDSVLVHVNCETGCTLTQGYWKTHNESFKGGAPADEGWFNIGLLGEDTLFFGTGKTWFDIFWTAPKGNAFYNLAHQYMAAKLNILNGASTTPAVDAAITGAEALFNAQGAGDVTLTKAERTAALGYAGTLGSFNEGLIGPGHCDEQNPQ